MQVEVQHERDANGLSTLTAEVPVEMVNEVYQVALRELRRHAQVPGFRPGKVPPRLVESIVGKEAVEQLAKERLEERVLPEIGKSLPHLVSIDEPQVELGTFVKDQPTEVQVKMLTAQVEIGAVEGLTVEQYRSDVTEEEAEAELQRFYASQAEVQPGDHEDVRTGDRVTFSLRIVRDGYLVDEYPADDPLGVVVGNNSLNPNIDEQLLGLSVGQDATFEVTYPEDHDNESLRGQTAEFTVSILSVGQIEALEAFVARVGLGESVDAARQAVAETIQERRNSYFRVMAREDAVVKLIEASTIDVPRSHLEAAVMEELDELEEAREEGDDEDGDGEEPDEEEVRQRVEMDLKRDILLQAVCQIHEVSVEVDDITREVSMISSYNRVSPDLLIRRLEESGELRQVIRNARLRKAAEYILEHAEVVEVEAPAPEPHVHDEHCDHDHEHDHDHGSAVAADADDEEPAIVDDPAGAAESE